MRQRKIGNGARRHRDEHVAFVEVLQTQRAVEWRTARHAAEAVPRGIRHACC